jgi:hypothetical protein
MLFDTITYVAGADHLYDIAGSTLSTPSDSDIITRFVATRAFSLPANLAGTKISVGTNPSSSATLTIKKNGSGVATITINSSGVETLPTQTAVSFAIDDILTIEVTTADSIDDLGITLKTLAV